MGGVRPPGSPARQAPLQTRDSQYFGEHDSSAQVTGRWSEQGRDTSSQSAGRGEGAPLEGGRRASCAQRQARSEACVN